MANTREKLILACEELAIKNNRGFYNLSLEELAKKAGVSKRTIYRHFSGKEELFEATIDTVVSKLVEKNFEIMAQEKDIKRSIPVLLKNVAYLVNPQVLKDLSTYYPLIWQKIDRLRKEKIDLLMDYLMNNNQMKMRWRVDPRIFKASLLAAMSEVINPSFILENGMTFEEAGYNFLDMFMFGAIETIPQD